jgi:peptide/nickel transport system permease protein
MRGYLRFLATRFLSGVLVVWGAATLTFLMLHLSTGDVALTILGGPEALPTPEVLARVRVEYGLDRPLLSQYAEYLGRIASFDLGESYRLRIPVGQAIVEQLPATLRLALASGMVAVGGAISMAIFSARRAPWVTFLVSGTELVATSIPGFVTGLLLLFVFSFRLPWLPAAGYHGWPSLVLPVVSLALPLMALLTQVLRQELDDILEQPFITTARLRGLSELKVRFGHALRHALIPLVTLSGFVFASLLGGTVIVETLFSQQGIGRLMYDATTHKDVPVVLGVTLLAAATYVVINLLVDLANGLIDPRHELS